MNARDDAALIAAALAGETSAFNEIMRLHKNGVYAFIRRYVGDADESYDLTQETFLAVWKSLAQFDARRSLGAWIRQIALNKCRDWSRRRAVRRFFYKAAPLESVDYDRTAAAPQANESDARLQLLERHIAALPAALKEPLLLCALEGLSHKDAAKVLGVSAKAVETRLYRARQILSQKLEQTGP